MNEKTECSEVERNIINEGKYTYQHSIHFSENSGSCKNKYNSVQS